MAKFIILFFLVWFVSYMICAVAWTQIFGGVRTIRKDRHGWLRTIFWLLVLFFMFLLVFYFLWAYKWAYIAALALSFVSIVRNQE